MIRTTCFALAAILALGRNDAIAVFTARVEVVDSTPGQFVPLELRQPLLGYTDRLIWSEFPPLLESQSFNVWKVAPPGAGSDPSTDYGIISFKVLENGPVLMAVTNRYENSGNPSGGWIPQLTSRGELEAAGWTEVANGLKAYDVPTETTGLEFAVFQRLSRAGESFTYRTEKYHPPLLLTSRGVYFQDDFQQEADAPIPPGYIEDYRNFAKWDVIGSGVDLAGPGGNYPMDFSKSVDLDGTSGSTLRTKEQIALPAGHYKLQFDLGGPLGGTAIDQVRVDVGDLFNETIAVARGSGFETYRRAVTVEESTKAHLSFTDLGADRNGAYLDNIVFREAIFGDLDLDDDVDSADLLQFQSSWTGVLDPVVGSVKFSLGDADDDGDVDSSDLLAFIGNWTGARASTMLVVPESIAEVSIAFAIAAILGSTRWRSLYSATSESSARQKTVSIRRQIRSPNSEWKQLVD